MIGIALFTVMINLEPINEVNWFEYLSKCHYYQKVEKLGNLETETGFKLYKTKSWDGNTEFQLIPNI